MCQEVQELLGPEQRCFCQNRQNLERWTDGDDYSFPVLWFGPEVGSWQEGSPQLLTFAPSSKGKVKDATKEQLNRVTV